MRYLVVLILWVTILPLQGQNNLNEGLLLYLNFNENTIDLSGNSNHGAINGSPEFVSGINSDALSFDGQYDYLTLSNSLQLGNTFTITAWIQADELQSDWQTVFSKYESNNYGPYWLGTHYDKVNLWISNGSGSHTDFDSAISLEPDKWHHIIWEVDELEARFYIDCVLDEATQTIPQLTQNNDIVTVGRQALYLPQTNNYADFGGEIDELRVYDRLLTPAEIEALCKGELTRSSEVISSPELEVFPNPARTTIKLQLPEGFNNGQVEVFNAHGQHIMNTQLQHQAIQLDVTHLNPGYYFLKVTSGKTQWTGRFIHL